MQKTYVREDVASTVVVDSGDQIVLYSVLVCVPDANLKITTSSATTLILQGPGIDSAETSGGGAAQLNSRRLYYLEGGTGSSLGQLIERSVDRPRSGNGWRSYVVGINRACGETGFGVEGRRGAFEYFGELSDAPKRLSEFRKSTPANFYTEIADNFVVTDDAMILWPESNAPLGPMLGSGPAYVSPYINDLPPDFTAQYWASR